MDMVAMKLLIQSINQLYDLLDEIDRRLAILEAYLPAIQKQHSGSIAPNGSLDLVLNQSGKRSSSSSPNGSQEERNAPNGSLADILKMVKEGVKGYDDKA